MPTQAHVLDAIVDQLSQVILSKQQQIKLSLTCLLAQGHLLIEDLPGMGKTTLAHSLAKVLGLDYERVQFTSDLLPGDILGVSIFDAQQASFRFHKGPVFTQLLLADEINRSTPKAQSALLEAMEERQVSIDGATHSLPEPFFVIATQNPMSQAGTHPLPESQLDRFLMCLSLGYPSHSAERELLSGQDPRSKIDLLPVLFPDMDSFKRLQTAVDTVQASSQLIDYIQRLVAYTRTDERFIHGLSPRGAMALLKAAKAWALLHHREYVLPDDVQSVLPAVVEHRVKGYAQKEGTQTSFSQILLENTRVVEA